MRAHTFIIVLSLSGCYRSYLNATNDFAAATTTTSDDLSDLSNVIVDLCVQESQLEYLTTRLNDAALIREFAPQQKLDPETSSWDGYLKSHLIDDPDNPGKKTTWQKLCQRYEPTGQALQKALASLHAYGTALKAVVNDATYDGSDLSSIASSIAPAAGKYSAAVSAVGVAVKDLAQVLVQWRVGKKTADLMKAADPAFNKALTALTSFVNKVQTEELANTRRALPEVFAALEEQQLKHEWFEAPPRADLKVKKQLSHDPDRVLVSLDFEAAWIARLDSLDGKLAAFQDALQQLTSAHATLTKAWQKKGSPEGDTDLRTAIGAITDVIAAINAFRSKGSGQ